VQHKLSSDPTLSQKRAVFPAFSSREVTLGQMHKSASILSSTPCQVRVGRVTVSALFWMSCNLLREMLLPKLRQ